jgi:hypothetical protein
LHNSRYPMHILRTLRVFYSEREMLECIVTGHALARVSDRCLTPSVRHLLSHRDVFLQYRPSGTPSSLTGRLSAVHGQGGGAHRSAAPLPTVASPTSSILATLTLCEKRLIQDTSAQRTVPSCLVLQSHRRRVVGRVSD